MGIDNRTIERLEEYQAYKRSKDPVIIEMNRLMNEVYPYEKLQSIFKFGSANMLALFKNNVYQYMCNDDKEYVDAIIQANSVDLEMKGFLDKLIQK